MGTRFGKFARRLQRFSKRPAPRSAAGVDATPTDIFTPYAVYTPYNLPLPGSIVVEPRRVSLPADEYVYTANLYEMFGVDESKTITVTEVQEFGISQNIRDATIPPVIADDQGTLTYEPDGTFLRNLLEIYAEIADKDHPPTIEAQSHAEVYGSIPTPVLSENVGLPTTATSLLAVENNVLTIGDPQTLQKFWQHQGLDSTCNLVAVSSVLLSLGIDVDYQELVRQATTDIVTGPQDTPFFRPGQPLYIVEDEVQTLIEPSKPDLPNDTLDDLESLPQDTFSEYIRVVREGDIMETQNLLNTLSAEGLSPSSPTFQYIQDLLNYRQSPTYDGYIETTPGEVRPNTRMVGNREIPLAPAGYAATARMLEYNGLTPRIGAGGNFSTVIQELEAGNPLIISVDADEFWENMDLQNIQDRSDLLSLLNRPEHLNSRQNHAVWLTGIEVDNTDPNNPRYYAIINDSGPKTGAGARYPLEVLIAAWEDSDFTYVTVGDAPPATEITTQRRAEIEERFRETIFANDDISAEKAKEYASTWFLKAIQDTDTLNAVEGKFPGTRELVIEYLEGIDGDRRAILQQYGLDPDLIEDIIEELDIED